MDWLRGEVRSHPAAATILEWVEPSLVHDMINFRNRPRGGPLPYPFEYRRETINDGFHGLLVIQSILETVAEGTQNLRRMPQARWALAGQLVYKAVGGAVMVTLISRGKGFKDVSKLHLAFSPRGRKWEMGTTIPGRGEDKRAIQAELKEEMHTRLPALRNWTEPLDHGNCDDQLLGHCAETRPALRFAAWLRSGGAIFALTLDIRRLFKEGRWLSLLQSTDEDGFWRLLEQDGITTPFCMNCEGFTSELSNACGCSIFDIESWL